MNDLLKKLVEIFKKNASNIKDLNHEEFVVIFIESLFIYNANIKRELLKKLQ